MRATLATIGLALGALSALAVPTGAQQPIRRVSMAEAIRLFGENSLGLRIARADADAMAGLARQSRGYPNPVLNVVREDLGDGDADYWETTVGIDQRVEWPGRTSARGRAAAHAIGAAEAAYRADSLRLAFEVRDAYIAAWAVEERARALRRTADVIGRISAAAERRLDEGDLSGYEARRLRVERARVEGEALQADLEASAARRGLAELVLPESDVIEIGPSDPLEGAPPPIDRQTALDGLAVRPDLEAARRGLEAAEAAAAAAATGWVPDPTFSIGYKDQADGFSGLALGLSLPVPLFDRRTGAHAAARAERRSAARGLALRQREARSDILTSLEGYASIRGRLGRVGDLLLGDADALLAAAETGYAEGELQLVELLDAARAYRDARFTAIALLSDTWSAYYDLLRAIGRAPEES